MIWLAIGLATFGLFFSALFSGSETGFYRATRIRLVLDAMGGDHVARGLHWLTNQPTLFIATTLVGNNLANYLVSLGIVMGAQTLWSGESHLADLIAPMVLAPVLFIYGELLPKNLFLHAPNRLLRMVGPVFLVCVVLFLPVSILLWGLNWILARFSSESPEMIRLIIARRELQRILEEGHEAGILQPAQRSLAQGTFALASRPIRSYSVPLEEVATATSAMSKSEILDLARRHRVAAVPVQQVGEEGRFIGYIRVVDLKLDRSGEVTPVRPLLTFDQNEKYIRVLTRLHGAKENMAAVLDETGCARGIVTVQRLREPLFRGGR